MSTNRPENVGILAMELYTPARYVPLAELEKADDCTGKYTGLMIRRAISCNVWCENDF